MEKRKVTPKEKMQPKPPVKKMDIINVMLILLLVVTLFSGVYFACTSPKFALKTMQVKGNNRLDSQTVARLSNVQYGENVFLLSRRDIRERIMVNPYVENVEVKKKPPNSVLVYVKELDIVGYVQSAGKYYLIDKEGSIVEEVGPEKIRKTDAKIELERVDIEMGTVLTKEQADFVKAMIDTSYFENIRGYTFALMEAPMIILEGGTKVAFNLEQDLEYQFQFLEQIIEKNAGTGKRIKKVTFRSDSDPIVETE